MTKLQITCVLATVGLAISGIGCSAPTDAKSDAGDAVPGTDTGTASETGGDTTPIDDGGTTDTGSTQTGGDTGPGDETGVPPNPDYSEPITDVRVRFVVATPDLETAEGF